MSPIERIDQLTKDLARVTAERDAAKAEALGNAASYRDADARRAENYRMLTTVQCERDVAKRDIVALRARVAELEKEAMILRGTVEAVTTQRQQAEQRVAELVAALDDLLECPTVTDRATCPNGDPSRIDEAPEWQAVLQISCAWTRYKKLKVLARRQYPDDRPSGSYTTENASTT